MTYKVAVVGATGNVGRELLTILAEREFPVSEVAALASQSSIGKEVSFGDEKILKVKALDTYDFAGSDIALFSPGASVSREHAPRAAMAGCIVIDNTSEFRYDADVPLIVPEVNSDALAGYTKRNIISNPNCSTMQMVVALKPLHDAATIKRVVVSTYQSVSGAGKSAMDELYDQTKSMYIHDERHPQNFSRRIAFNVIPQIDVLVDGGVYKEEWKMEQETKKILDASIELTATCVRVPVFISHSEAVNVEFKKPISAEDAREILKEAPGITVEDDPERGLFTTPVDAVGEDAVFVSRIRKDPTIKHGLNMWVVSDNLRKGAALNAIQIAESLVEQYNLKPKAAA